MMSLIFFSVILAICWVLYVVATGIKKHELPDGTVSWSIDKRIWYTFAILIGIHLFFNLNKNYGIISQENFNSYKNQKIIETNKTNSANYAVMRGNTWWTPYEHLEEFVNAVIHRDADRLATMANSGKIFKVSRDTKVISSDSGIYDGIVFVTFQEGEFSNKQGYTLSKCVR